MRVGTALSDVIINSPMAMLEEHVQGCAKCVAKLPEYFEAAQAGQWERARKVQEDIAALESAADDLKGAVRKNLPRGLWMSVSRTDLLELVRIQDKMANETKDVVGLSLGRQLAFPKQLEKSLGKYIATVVDSANAAVAVVSATRDVARAAFGAREIKAISSRAVAVERLERKSDDLESKLRAKLMAHEEKLSPIDAMFLYQLLLQIGEIADSAEKVSHRAQIIANS